MNPSGIQALLYPVLQVVQKALVDQRHIDCRILCGNLLIMLNEIHMFNLMFCAPILFSRYAFL